MLAGEQCSVLESLLQLEADGDFASSGNGPDADLAMILPVPGSQSPHPPSTADRLRTVAVAALFVWVILCSAVGLVNISIAAIIAIFGCIWMKVMTYPPPTPPYQDLILGPS